MLRLLSKLAWNRTKTGLILDPAELDVAQQKLFCSSRTNLFLLNGKVGKSLHQSEGLQQLLNFFFLLDRRDYFAQRNVPSHWIFYIWNKTSWDTRYSMSVFPPVSVASTWATLPPRCRVNKGSDTTELLTTLRFIQLKCVTCRKRKVKFFTVFLADFPRETSPHISSTHQHRDRLFWPFYVSVKLSTEKPWGFFSTGLITCAVHFIVASSMDTSSWVMGIDRFAARRGVPAASGLTVVPTSLQLKKNFRTTFSTVTSRHWLTRSWRNA